MVGGGAVAALGRGPGAGGQRELAGWWGAGRPAAWTDVIAAARALGRAVGVTVEVLMYLITSPSGVSCPNGIGIG